MTRKDKKIYANDRNEAVFTIETMLEIWGTNSTLVDKKAKLNVTLFDLHSDWRHEWEEDVVLAQNSSTEVFSGPLPEQQKRTKNSDVPKVIVVSARLLDDDGTVLGRYSNWYVFL